MANLEFELIQGLTTGSTQHTYCVLREATAGDFIAASEESEKVVAFGLEPELVTSPTLVGINMLRRQIERIGDLTGPLERELIDKLSINDLNLIRTQAEKLEEAARRVSQRGRSDGDGEGDEDSD